MTDSVYGIDLGTTYSAIARISALGAPEIINNFEGDQTTPSAVFFESPGNAVVGKEAKNAAVTDPDNSCMLIKKHMGTEFPQDFHGETFTPEALSALILRELVNAANQESDSEVSKVVITVPAYFGVQERQATRQAGQMANLDVVGIVTEPVAAALSIGSRSDGPETIMVYDLGGGTFDTTIMRVDSGKVSVLAIDGNRVLGGSDWDRALIDLIADRFVSEADLEDDDPRHDEEFMQDLALKAEELKKSLTRKENAKIRPDYAGKRVDIDVLRSDFEEATAHLLEQTIEIAERTVKTAQGKNPDLKIDRVLLVGGSSRMPMVRNALKDRLGWEAQDTEFDLAVAKGAAIYGQAAIDEVLVTGDEVETVEPQNAVSRPYFPGQAGTLTVSNVLSRGVGMEFVRDSNPDDPYIAFFAHANDGIPFTPEPTRGYTSVANQASVNIKMYQQSGEIESDVVEDNVLLKESSLELSPGLPKESEVEIYVDITAEGVVKLRVVDPKSGNETNLEATVSVLSEEEIAQQTKTVSGITLRS
ncbi:Hsp70 family protein [Glutamicibacter sp. NPDC087344]|uniref:Hsp70 family protein n=1 Tax=Glutamicibacter sp. NPDC087344 TaxID=3363994 RepID=UPI00380F026D